MAQPPDTTALAEALLGRCRDRGIMLATAESCTGGMIAAALTDIPGSSDVVERGFVTYSNEAKTEMIGVDAGTIAAHGAVSEPVARAMAEGALARSRAQMTVAVTGVAGPGGGTETKPVGLVHIAVARRNGPTMHRRCLFEDHGRAVIRTATVLEAFAMLDEALDD